MRIRRVRIENYRSIVTQDFDFEDLTVLVGPNGVGKSSVLKAMQTFYETTPILTRDDYFNRDDTQPVRITVTFGDFVPQEASLLAHYIDRDTLAVSKVISPKDEKYHGTRMQHPGFAAIRAKKAKTEKRAAYNELRSADPYRDLPSATSADVVESNLQAWESSHSDKLERLEDDGQFFGFRNVGQSRLERFTQFLLIPAVRDAEDLASDARGSAIFQLMELVVRSALAQNERFTRFRSEVQQEYEELISPASLTELRGLSERLSWALRKYVPTASVLLEWQRGGELTIPLPKAFVRLEEDGFCAPVDRVGHGLQRAFIMSLLQELVNAQSRRPLGPAGDTEAPPVDETDENPNLILAIEEPELYQHPNRQRHLARVLAQLSRGVIPGVAQRTQVIYSTHSPLFLDIERFDAVRRLAKTGHLPGLPRKTCVSMTSLNQVASRLSTAHQQAPTACFTGESLRPRLLPLMTPWMNEGFFADLVILVEGEGDRAAILGAALRENIDFEARGVAVIPCMGKGNMDRPWCVFTGLGIPCYMVFDADGGEPNARNRESSARVNRALQRLLGVADVRDYPGTHVAATHAVFQTKLDTVIREAVGQQIWERVALQFRDRYGYADTERCTKSPAFVKAILDASDGEGIRIAILSEIVQRIVAIVPESIADSPQ